MGDRLVTARCCIHSWGSENHVNQMARLTDLELDVKEPGLGRVLDKSTRVQVQVLEKMTSTSTSTGFSKVLEYKYKYF